MSGEAGIQTGIQAILQSMTEFADADVVINDWSVLDQPNENAPYVIISNADEFDSKQDVKTAETTWQEVITLVEAFSDWATTLNNLRTRRQAIIDKFNAVGSARSAGGLAATTMDRLRSEGPITPYYGPYVPQDQLAEAMPIYLMQSLLMQVEEY